MFGRSVKRRESSSEYEELRAEVALSHVRILVHEIQQSLMEFTKRQAERVRSSD